MMIVKIKKKNKSIKNNQHANSVANLVVLNMIKKFKNV